MSKFLTICEEFDPNYQGDPKWELIDFLKSKGVNVSLVKGTDMVYIDTGSKTIAVTVSSQEKHYWVTELAKKSHEKRVLTKQKKKLKEALTEKLINEGIVTLNKQTLDSLENSEKIDDINEKLHDVEAAINYLEYIVKNVVFIGNDIKNIISWKQLNE